MNNVNDFLNSFLKKDDTIVVCVSAGPDSMCLIDKLISFKVKYNLNLIVAHVNHNKREQSEEEKIYVETYCKNNNLIFEYLSIENYGDDNFQTEARNKRYDFFEQLVNKYKANYLMTAHHGDDLIESILMKISRGSTLSGYLGFKQITDRGYYKIVRPLIYLTKQEIEEYNQVNNIKYYVDESNKSNHYTRNRYRHFVLPFLKEEDSEVHIKYLKFNKLLENYSNYFDNMTKSIIEKIYNNNILDLNKFNTYEEIIKKHIISNILYEIYIDDIPLINDNHVNLIVDLIESRKQSASITLPNNLIIKKDYKNLIFNYNNIEEHFDIEFDKRIEFNDGHIIEKTKKSNDFSNYVIHLSSKEIKLPLYVRNRKEGDIMEVKNLNGTKKVKDIFIDSKISMDKRNSIPLLFDANDNLLWIPGVKKSKFDKSNKDFYDIIIKYS